jgi:hypothetical protein
MWLGLDRSVLTDRENNGIPNPQEAATRHLTDDGVTRCESSIFTMNQIRGTGRSAQQFCRCLHIRFNDGRTARGCTEYPRVVDRDLEVRRALARHGVDGSVSRPPAVKPLSTALGI